MFKSTLKDSQLIDVCGPYSQINSIRNSNVFSCVLEFLQSAALISEEEYVCMYVCVCMCVCMCVCVYVSYVCINRCLNY